ncbi:hypothetical protein D6833_00490 [Candidatus Parcubacteria bacterium]|nr:MAG: hypothetical protein D6833_00490 [Candidatus Parcubacteria bacterium]
MAQARKSQNRGSKRFVMYIPNTLRDEIEACVNETGMTLAEFGREAFATYLCDLRRKKRDAQLAETCRLLDGSNQLVLRNWTKTESEMWHG